MTFTFVDVILILEFGWMVSHFVKYKKLEIAIDIPFAFKIVYACFNTCQHRFHI